MQRIIARLREPSTMAGLAVILGLCGLPAGVPELVTQVLTGAAGLAAMLMHEKGAQ